MAQHLQRQSIRSPPPSDEKGVALFPLRRFSDDERRREEYFAGVERGVAHSLRERGERGFGDAVARLADRRELSGTPSNTSVETPQNSSMRPPPRYVRRPPHHVILIAVNQRSHLSIQHLVFACQRYMSENQFPVPIIRFNHLNPVWDLADKFNLAVDATPAGNSVHSFLVIHLKEIQILSQA